MISPAVFVDHLRTLGVSMFVGVPDSLLKPFSQYVMNELPRSEHVITANEGAAVGFALGHHLRVGSPAAGSSKGAVSPSSRATPARSVSQTLAAPGDPLVGRLESRRRASGR